VVVVVLVLVLEQVVLEILHQRPPAKGVQVETLFHLLQRVQEVVAVELVQLEVMLLLLLEETVVLVRLLA
jgi:hypothetical protein